MGKTQHGKSYFLKVVTADVARLLVVDPMGEWDAHVDFVARDPHEAKAWLVRRGAGHCDVPFRLAGRCRDLPGDALDYLELGFRLPGGDGGTYVVCEEISLYSSASHCPPPLSRLIRMGRHRRIHVVTTTQRPADTPALARSQADVVAAFRLDEELDLRALRPYFKAETAALSNLNIGEFRYVDRRPDGLWKALDGYLDRGERVE